MGYKTKSPSYIPCYMAISLCLGWQQITFDLQVQVILSDIATQNTYSGRFILIHAVKADGSNKLYQFYPYLQTELVSRGGGG